MQNTHEPFQWVEATGPTRPARHAIPHNEPNDQDRATTAICGEQITIHAHHPQREAPYPECFGCDRTWRQVEGIPSVLDEVKEP
jgi:zinc-finger